MYLQSLILDENIIPHHHHKYHEKFSIIFFEEEKNFFPPLHPRKPTVILEKSDLSFLSKSSGRGTEVNLKSGFYHYARMFCEFLSIRDRYIRQGKVVKINFSIAISINTVLIAFADGVKLILNCNYLSSIYLSIYNMY